MEEVSQDPDHDHQSVSTISGTHSSSGAVLMPEYVVGAKKQQRPARPTAQALCSSASSVMLSHLDDDDDEEDEEPLTAVLTAILGVSLAQCYRDPG